MIVRMWSGQTAPDGAPTYLRHVTEDVSPALARIDGFFGARVLRRDVGSRVEFVVVTHWRSISDIRAFAGDDVEIAVVAPQARAVLLDFDSTVRHFEVACDTQE